VILAALAIWLAFNARRWLYLVADKVRGVRMTKIILLTLMLSVSNQSRPIQTVNLKCGIPPIPPIGCQVGACVC